MASFTGDAGNVSPQYSVSAKPSFLSGLSALAGGVLDKFGQDYKTEGVNEAARGAYKAMSDADALASGVPQEAVDAVGDLKTIQSSVAQGRSPATTLDMTLQQQASTFMNKYPDQAASIATFYQSHGFDNAMFRSIKNQLALDQKVVDTKQQAYTEGLKYGLDNGLTGDDNTVSANGRRLLIAHNQFAAAKEAADAAKADTEANTADTKAQLDIAQRNAVSALWLDAQTKINPIISTLTNFIQGVNGDPDREKKILALAPLVQSQIAQYKIALSTAAAQAHMTPDDPRVKGLLDSVDQIGSTAKDLISGNQSEFQSVQNTLKFMNDKFGIDNATSFPLYSQLKGLLGPQVMATMFGPNGPQLPDATVKALQQELNGFGTMDQAHGRVALQEAAATLKGQLKLSQVNPANLPAVVSTNVAASQAYKNAILKGDTSPDTGFNFYQAQSNLIDASFSIQPQGSPDLKSITLATSQIANPGVRAVMDKLVSNGTTKENGLALVTGSRGAAENLLQAAKNASVSNGYQGTTAKFVSGQGTVQQKISAEVRFDPKSGRYVVMNDGAPASVVSGLQQKANVQNALIDHLVETTKYDDTLPKGATNLSLRNFYANGGELLNSKGQSLIDKKKGQTASEDFDQQIEKFRENLSQNKALDTSKVTALPASVADAQIMQESGGRNGIVSNQGAVGVAQIRPEDFPQYDAERLKNDPEYAKKARDEIMSGLIKKYNGNVGMALAEYHGGPDMKNWGPKTWNYVTNILGKSIAR